MRFGVRDLDPRTTGAGATCSTGSQASDGRGPEIGRLSTTGAQTMLQNPPDSGAATARVDGDAGLVEALRREDPAAVDLLVERYADRVYRLASRIVGLKEDAEEAAQDALWTVVRKIHTFRGESAFASWLYRVAANAAYQKLRKRRRRAPELALDDVLPPLDADGHFAPMEDWSRRIDEHVLQAELREILIEAIDALPADYRTALVLRDIEGLSNPEIAQTLGVSLPAAKSRVHRSRLFVRQRLSEYLRSETRDPAGR